MKKLAMTLIPFSFINLSCSSFGNSPDKDRKTVFSNSKNFNLEKEAFQNRRPELVEEMAKRTMNFSSLAKFFFTTQEEAAPDEKLPEIKPDLEDFMLPSKDLKSIWFGHTSFLLNMNGTIILVDPVFSKTASPVSFTTKRFQAPVLSLEELPRVDVVLISHDHYDHLDMDTIKYFKNKSVTFITPLGVGSHLQHWGVSPEKIIEKDWWESVQISEVEFVATPAQHFSGRSLTDKNKTLWASWVIRSNRHNVYFSGDTGYDTHFKDIGAKYGPFDVAFLETGQYNEKWQEVHMLPSEGVQAYKDLGAKKYFPVHWGMFVLALHKWYEPIEEVYKAAEGKSVNFVIPKLGEIVNYSSEYKPPQKWWQKK